MAPIRRNTLSDAEQAIREYDHFRPRLDWTIAQHVEQLNIVRDRAIQHGYVTNDHRSIRHLISTFRRDYTEVAQSIYMDALVSPNVELEYDTFCLRFVAYWPMYFEYRFGIAPEGEPEHEPVLEPEPGQEDGLVPEDDPEEEPEEDPEEKDEPEEDADPTLDEFSDVESCVTEGE